MRDPVDNMRRVDPYYREPRGKIRFSKTEVLHIAVAIGVLSVAFSLIMRNSTLDPDDPTMNIILIAGTSFILVVCSFLFHEFGHKFVAQRYNAWSEFRAYPQGLMMAIVFSIMGFLFAAPGAVYIRGMISKEMNGKISLAGPAVNFVISAIAIAVFFSIEPGTLVYVVVGMLAYLNAFLGLFNMIPVLPFDGSKIVAWSIPVYAMAAIVGAVELAIVFLYVI
ncbi:MAG: site-2 protease family protein [Candidatus Methanoplasma sp.]|jgi:Zn-dependent protease|nr:site-2 protease family protein [Candidatus Methanoplasma sp.]